jgi:hypothetical protein
MNRSFYLNRAELIQNNDAVVSEFAKRIDQNLATVEYSGPSMLFGQDLIALMMELLLSVLEGCISQRSKSEMIQSMKAPSIWQRMLLRRRMKRELYQGNKRFESMDGEGVYQAFIKTTAEAEDDELSALIDYVEGESIPDVDFGSL